jgi:hypothetical protein
MPAIIVKARYVKLRCAFEADPTGMLEPTLDVRTAVVSGVLIFSTALLVVIMDRMLGLTRRIS